jgi:dGTPase
VGRSLGLVGKKSSKNITFKEVHGYHMNDFGAIVAAASLAHDIESTFGHSVKKRLRIFSMETDKNTRQHHIKNGKI